MILELNNTNSILSAKDISLGGLLVGICKIAFQKKIGVRLDLSGFSNYRLDELLFGETSSCVIISYKHEKEKEIIDLTNKSSLIFYKLGETQNNFYLTLMNLGLEFNFKNLEKRYENGLYSVFHS